MAPLKNTASRAKALDFSNLLTTGAVAGLAVGFPFILANMIYATSQSALPVPNAPKLPALAPFFDIGTIFYFDDMPQLMNPSYPLAGLITHFSLAIVFGLIFALVLVPLLSNARLLLLVGGVAYGLLVYVVNYQILGRVLFEWFDPSSPMGPDPWFGLITHLGFGLLLVPFFLTSMSRSAR